MPSSSPYAKGWVFTLNNPPDDFATTASNIYDSGVCDILAYQHEIAPTTGTPHVQGVVYFKERRRLTYLRGAIANAHFEVMKGTLAQAVAYCSKEDTRAPGTEPVTLGAIATSQGKRNELVEVKRRIDEGATETEILDEFPSTFIRYQRGISYAKRLKQADRTVKTRTIVVLGRTGAGKSYYAHHYSESSYTKQNDTPWWDGYDGQDTVILDEFYGWVRLTELLRLMDEYPMLVQTKGGQSKFVAKTLIITSNSTPERWYSEHFAKHREHRAAFNRRVDKWIWMESRDLIYEADDHETFCNILKENNINTDL